MSVFNNYITDELWQNIQQSTIEKKKIKINILALHLISHYFHFKLY